jgi:hypothetical protein
MTMNSNEPGNAPISPGGPAVANTEVAQAGLEVPPGIQRSQEAFRRDLPLLLQEPALYRQWVAYRGEERIGIAPSKRVLYQECLSKGMREDEFVVRRILPEVPREVESLSDV